MFSVIVINNITPGSSKIEVENNCSQKNVISNTFRSRSVQKQLPYLGQRQQRFVLITMKNFSET